MKKTRLFLLVFIALISTHVSAYDFYIQTVGGGLNGRVKYFTKLTNAMPDGWVSYRMEYLDPKSLVLIEREIFVNCHQERVSFVEPQSLGIKNAKEITIGYKQRRQEHELIGILGPACKT